MRLLLSKILILFIIHLPSFGEELTKTSIPSLSTEEQNSRGKPYSEELTAIRQDLLEIGESLEDLICELAKNEGHGAFSDIGFHCALIKISRKSSHASEEKGTPPDSSP